LPPPSRQAGLTSSPFANWVRYILRIPRVPGCPGVASISSLSKPTRLAKTKSKKFCKQKSDPKNGFRTCVLWLAVAMPKAVTESAAEGL
jgi:hypothetical protein